MWETSGAGLKNERFAWTDSGFLFKLLKADA